MTTALPPTATKKAFLAAYREYLESRPYPWAKDKAAVDRFMTGVEKTITTDEATWIHTDSGGCAAWKAIGGKGKPTLKALRALP